MNRTRTLVVIVLVFALLIAGASVLYSRLGKDITPDQMGNQQDKTPAPDFVVVDGNGNTVKLSDYAGKPIVLNFWASWCGPCQMEMPDFQEKFMELGDEVVFLMVNMTDGARETIQSASDFIAQKGYTFPVLFDVNYDAATAYSVYSLPTTYFIDAQANVVAKFSGPMSESVLQQYIDMIW